MKVELIAQAADKLNGSTLVLFATTIAEAKGKKSTAPTSHIKSAHPEIKAKLNDCLDDKSFSGKSGEIISFRGAELCGFKNIIFAGLGDEKDLTPESFRSIGGTLESALSSAKLYDVVIAGDSIPLKHHEQNIQAVAEGLVLSSYRFETCKSKKEDTPELKIKIQVSKKTKSLEEHFNEGLILAETVNFSKYLGDMPGNLMTPTILAEEAKKAAKGLNVKVTAWDKAKIKKEKMGGLLGVAEGSDQDPRFIIMEYYGAAKTKKPVVFVGKGLTFDTGGISLKPGASMEEMKYDMCGGANVIGTLLAIAKLKLKVNAIALIPATENMPSGRATKPGDIHTARNGKTFEVNNTDAEGRLILSDALCYASELKPQVIVDAATLTGAMVIALGNIHTGFFTRNDSLTKTINEAAEKSGELVWRMPLCDYHLKDMKGTYADLSNISSGKGAGSATAAAFLEQFVEKDIPWVHFDIAGTGWGVGNRLTYAPKKGASGCMVRTFVNIAKSYK